MVREQVERDVAAVRVQDGLVSHECLSLLMGTPEAYLGQTCDPDPRTTAKQNDDW
ncbi:hypothetical protein GCM10027062_12260 [Nocardioides hungaricus]